MLGFLIPNELYKQIKITNVASDDISLFQGSGIDIDHANMFDRILVQDHGGRIKPLSTLTSEYIRKISRKNYLYNNNLWMIIQK